MKVTDIGYRVAPFDTYLKGDNLTGIEVGADVGAHAEAMLTFCSVKKLYLVDPWENPVMAGYCQGRMETKGWKNKVELVAKTSHSAALHVLLNHKFDFIYIDIPHDYKTVYESLVDWWPKLEEGGIMGYRNYSNTNINSNELNRAVDQYVKEHAIRTVIELGEIILFK